MLFDIRLVSITSSIGAFNTSLEYTALLGEQASGKLFRSRPVAAQRKASVDFDWHGRIPADVRGGIAVGLDVSGLKGKGAVICGQLDLRPHLGAVERSVDVELGHNCVAHLVLTNVSRDLMLEKQMHMAAAKEDFETAAKIQERLAGRDRIAEHRAAVREKQAALEKQMQALAARKDFKGAAVVKQQIEALAAECARPGWRPGSARAEDRTQETRAVRAFLAEAGVECDERHIAAAAQVLRNAGAANVMEMIQYTRGEALVTFPKILELRPVPQAKVIALIRQMQQMAREG